ncbi:MAG TPA: ABC transporter permease [Hypericibacter adhaerens]|uniref:ABC transporter permease n=1 Tax=Hypericibacter adhaerens TaxID=2602016 RepID=A0A5J6MX69_9PROT|nr:ABC transporter permease [Hypericibacter adhaerens]QEX21754.1 ABC transporter permease [Hypericibacter adhaerens]HWA42443.1 ABC transporter permease [Hypericibacter adhaerens]
MSARRVLAIAYLLLALGFIFLPVVMLVQYSFQDGLLPVPPFKGVSLRWYEAFLANDRLIHAMGNSALVAIASSAVATALGFLAAYGMARRRRRLNLGLQLLLMAPIAVSYLIIAMGLLIVFNWLGIDRSLLAVGIGHVVINLPLCFAITYSQLGEHQANIERAAHDLGASDLKALLLVTVPMLWPALLAGFLIAATLSWDEFVIAFLLSKFEVTMPVMIWSMLRSGLNPALNAAGTVVFAVSILFVILIELLQARSRRNG